MYYDLVIWIVWSLLIVICGFSIFFYCAFRKRLPEFAYKGEKRPRSGVFDSEETEKFNFHDEDTAESQNRTRPSDDSGDCCVGVTSVKPGFYAGGVPCFCACSLLIAYIIAVILVVIICRHYADGLFFFPESSSQCSATCDMTTPGAAPCCDYDALFANVNISSVNYTDSLGNDIAGYLLVNSTSAASATPWLFLLYSHGSGWNVAVNYRLARYQTYLSVGKVAIFTYDYPGYGKSTGTPTEQSIIASAVDGSGGGAVGAAVASFSALAGRDVSTSEIVIMGRSMGGAVATAIASELDFQIRGLVLQSTFTSAPAAVALQFSITKSVVLANFAVKFESNKRILPFKGCLYDSHSRIDEWVAYADGRRLYLDAANKNTSCSEFITTQVHHDDPLTQPEIDALSVWLHGKRSLS